MTDDLNSSTDHRRGQSSCGAEVVAVEQLSGQQFIRLQKDSKRPVSGEGPEIGPHHHRDDPALLDHVDTSGNVGRVCRDDLVVLDVDSEIVANHIDHLPETLEIGTHKGRHLWFSCPENIGSRISISENGRDLGSVRTGHDYALVPPSVHPSGANYSVLENREIATVSRASLMGIEPAVRQTLETADSTAQHRDSTAQHRDSTAVKTRRPSSRRSDAVADALSMVHHDERRAELADILRNTEPHHDEKQYLVGFLHCTVGLSEHDIVDIIMSNARWSDLDRKTTERQVVSVIESADNPRGGR